MKIIINEQQLKNLVKKILTEQKGEEIYNKFYSDIDKDLFIKIISADPISKIDNNIINFIGRGGKWLIDLYRKGKLKRYDEDLPKATDYLEIYYKYKNKFKDISHFDSLPDLYDSVKDYFAKSDSSLKNILISLNDSEYKKLYEDNKWIVYQPLTEKAACYLGVNTEWCTTYGEHSLDKRFVDRDNNGFNDYSDDLFIIINKKDEDEKYQFHIRSDQYMNENDDDINLIKFWKNNPKLSDFFTPFFENKAKNIVLFNKYGISDELLKLPPKFLKHFTPKLIEEMNRRIQEFEDNGLDDILGLTGFPLKEVPKHWVNIKGGLNLRNTLITSIGNLESVGLSLVLENTPITNLGNLESVDGDLHLQNTPITSLGNLKSVGKSLGLSDTPITSLGNLEYVGGTLNLYNTPITDLGNLNSVGVDLYLQNTPITSLGNLKSVGQNLSLRGTPLSEKYTIKELEEKYPQFKGKFKP